MSDFTKLAKAAGGPRLVLKYCLRYLTGKPWSGGHGFRFPTGFDGGPWAWPPTGEGPGRGNNSTGPGTGIFGTGGDTATGPAIGSVPGTGSAPGAGSAPGSTPAQAGRPGQSGPGRHHGRQPQPNLRPGADGHATGSSLATLASQATGLPEAHYREAFSDYVNFSQ